MRGSLYAVCDALYQYLPKIFAYVSRKHETFIEKATKINHHQVLCFNSYHLNAIQFPHARGSSFWSFCRHRNFSTWVGRGHWYTRWMCTKRSHVVHGRLSVLKVRLLIGINLSELFFNFIDRIRTLWFLPFDTFLFCAQYPGRCRCRGGRSLSGWRRAGLVMRAVCWGCHVVSIGRLQTLLSSETYVVTLKRCSCRQCRLE